MNAKPVTCARCGAEFDANRRLVVCPHRKFYIDQGVQFVVTDWDGREGLTRHTGGSSLGHVSGLAIGKLE